MDMGGYSCEYTGLRFNARYTSDEPWGSCKARPSPTNSVFQVLGGTAPVQLCRSCSSQWCDLPHITHMHQSLTRILACCQIEAQRPICPHMARDHRRSLGEDSSPCFHVFRVCRRNLIFLLLWLRFQTNIQLGNEYHCQLHAGSWRIGHGHRFDWNAHHRGLLFDPNGCRHLCCRRWHAINIALRLVSLSRVMHLCIVLTWLT